MNQLAQPQLSSVVLALLALVFNTALTATEIEIPKSLDKRLKIELFAAEPDVMTITGLTVDAKGRVLAVESHTHFRPDDYTGPKADRIRMLEDTDGDGRADRVSTFFSGTKFTMNVAVHPNGWVYVATRNSVFRLLDSDDDGVADKRQNLVFMETKSDYPHNGISGFAFDFSGNVYFGLGENMGQDGVLHAGSGDVYFTVGQNSGEPATIVSREGRRVAANRGAGGVFRCRADGSDLRRVAVGFWNPFHLGFDAYGRMFLGDNDPGNRPPCRFLNIVDGGDYGYRRRTLEPFISVNGETPGTLPMTSSTGESPTGTVVYESDNLPEDYRGDVLIASWGEHRLDRYHLVRDGASFNTTSQAVIAGGESFRPAGIAVAPDGSLFVGDWADRSYDLHSKGRIWHVRAAEAKLAPKRRFDSDLDALHSADRTTRENAARRMLATGQEGISALADELQSNRDSRVVAVALDALVSAKAMNKATADAVLENDNEAIREQATRILPLRLIKLASVASNDMSPAVQAAALRRIDDPSAIPMLLNKLGSLDPFMQQAARRGLGQSADVAQLVRLSNDRRAQVRLAVMLLLRDADRGAWKSASGLPESQRDRVIHRALQDTDSQVRFATVEWVGRDRLERFRQPLIDGLASQANSTRLFKAYLAALAQLDGVMEHWAKGSVGDWWVKKADSQRYVSQLLDRPDTSASVRQQVLLFLPAAHPAMKTERLQAFIDAPEKIIRLEAVRSLRSKLSGETRKKPPKGPSSKEAAILSALAADESRSADLRAEAIVGLDHAKPAEREILLVLVNDRERTVSHESLRTLRGAELSAKEVRLIRRLAGDDDATAELVQKLLAPAKTVDRPDVVELDRWMKLLEGPADPQAGQRIFFHPRGPACARCHRLDGRGFAIGPSLLREGGRLALNRRKLIEAILQPSKNVDPGFTPLLIQTTDGRVASGIYHKHGRGIRQVYDSNGKILSFKISEIEAMAPQATSIMPDGLGDAMTLQEFRDLLAYLEGAGKT